MSIAPFDTLKLAQRRRDDAGLSQSHAEGAAQSIAESMGMADLATKADLLALKTEIETEIQTVRTELQAVRTEREIDILLVRTELGELERRMTIKHGGMLVVGFGLVLAALGFVHP